MGRADGEPCIRSDECTGGYCVRRGEFPGGYCTKVNCRDDAECSRPDGVCLQFDNLRYCAAVCNPACRAGYVCEENNGLDVCVPEPEAPAGDRPHGAACERNDQCVGRLCLRDPAWPAGYCTDATCANNGFCAAEPGQQVECLPALSPTPGVNVDEMCTVLCESAADCRADYACVFLQPGLRACLPDNAAPLPLDPPGSYPFDMTCGLVPTNGALSIPFTLPPNTTSYGVTVAARDGRYILPVRIQGPAPLNFIGPDFRYAETGWRLRNISPTLVPLTPTHANRVQPGAYTYHLESQSQDICFFVFTEGVPGTRLDINLYYAGVSGYSAANGPNHPDIVAMLNKMDEVFLTGGIDVGTVRHFDVSAAAANRHRFIRDFEQVYELGLESNNPGPTLSDRLSLNVFLIEEFRVPDSSAIGVSPGAPGVFALHGLRGTGVVMEGSFLGQTFMGPDGDPIIGNEVAATTLAHEVGHFLGLDHTTERSFEHDLIPDTPECTPQLFPDACPDLGNLMFPIAATNDVSLTPGQGFVLGANPVTKE